MDKAKKKRIIVYVSTIILSIVYLFTAYKIAIGNGVFGDKEDVVSVRAKVLRITDEKETVSEEDLQSSKVRSEEDACQQACQQDREAVSEDREAREEVPYAATRLQRGSFPG